MAFELLLALLALQLGQLGLEDLHGPVLVLVLAALVLARHHHPGGQVGEAHGRVGHVDVLAAGARRAVGVDPEVLLVDVDVGHVLEERGHLQRRERGLALALGVERRHPHQAVHPVLGAQPPVGVATVDQERGRRDARLRPRRDLVELDVEAPPLGPAQVHAQQHVGPVLGIGPALAGLDLADGVGLVVLAGEQRAQLELVEGGRRSTRSDLGDLGLERLVGLLPGQLVERLGVVDAGPSESNSSRSSVSAASSPFTLRARSGSSHRSGREASVSSWGRLRRSSSMRR